jgi:Schlafen, AlbA_2
MNSPNIVDFLLAADPLTMEAAKFLVNYKEEDDRVDYKLEIDPHAEKDWLELTKDLSAFANTFGGFLVFGVQNKNKKLVGIQSNLASILEDANNVLQKVNRHLEPQLENVRCKAFKVDSKTIVVAHIPQSMGRTHLISKDGEFVYPSGQKKTILRKGTFYVRRSASNHLGDSRDLDVVIERRIDQFREALMDKVAKVVKAPATSDVFILTKDPEDKEAKRFVIQDAPDSIPVKGMSFTVAPQGPEEEIAAWSTLSSGNSEIRPPEATVWTWYADRTKLTLSVRYRLSVFQFSLWADSPVFYWIQGLRTQEIQESLLHALRRRPPGSEVKQMLVVAAFLGKSFYNRVLDALGSYKDRIAPAMRSFPGEGARNAFGTIKAKPKQATADCKDEQLAILNEIAETSKKGGRKPGRSRQVEAQKIDCFLYAQDDKYQSSST